MQVNNRAECPVGEIRREWLKMGVSDRRQYDADGSVSAKIRDFLLAVVQEPCCIDINNPHRAFGCSCMFGMQLSQQEMTRAISFILDWAKWEKKRQMWLVIEWMKYSAFRFEQLARRTDKHKTFIMVGTNDQLVCRNSLC